MNKFITDEELLNRARQGSTGLIGLSESDIRRAVELDKAEKKKELFKDREPIKTNPVQKFGQGVYNTVGTIGSSIGSIISKPTITVLGALNKLSKDIESTEEYQNARPQQQIMMKDLSVGDTFRNLEFDKIDKAFKESSKEANKFVDNEIKQYGDMKALSTITKVGTNIALYPILRV